jgi:hypothetical protein
MTAPVFTPISDPMYALCPECRAMETLDAATGRCRLCWRAWRWSPVGWGKDSAGSTPARLPRLGRTGGRFDSGEVLSGEANGTGGPPDSAAAESAAGAPLAKGNP